MSFILAISHRCRFVATTLKRFKMSSGPDAMEVFVQKRNPLTGCSEWDVGVDHDEYDYHQEIARSAFADMLHDTERNKMYYRALQLAIEKMHRDGKPANVLDIGTGTGLLSMMAAKCGADTITACEAFKPMADCCLKILAHNGYADKIKLIPKRSTHIVVGENGDMKEKANILVTEVFDTELIGEGALSTFSHAHKHLLEEDCIVVPDSAVIYAQVVECPFLQKWNKLDDVNAPEFNYVLKTPKKMKDCAGSAAVHDLQLSQLHRSSFQELSDKIPVFYYDWSGNTPIVMNRMVKQEFKVNKDGIAQMVFMWWELNMDPEGRIVLSCAPWWSHHATNMAADRPQDTIPWRDHWMQAVYYLPQEKPVKKDTNITLVCCQDEYSLWFQIENGMKHYQRPICECGVHMAWSRTHVSYLNDDKRSKSLRNQLKQELTVNSVVLDMNGSSLLGLLAAKISKKVYIHEVSKFNIDILQEYIKENRITNVEFVPELTEDVLENVTNVICDPVLSSSILPWENLKAAYTLYKFKNYFKAEVSIIPKIFELWAMPVKFQDLHKIRFPLKKCEGFDMSIFDNLVENSRSVSDDEIEAQPLWEYPCQSSGIPHKLLQIDFQNLKSKYAVDRSFKISCTNLEPGCAVNGFALWPIWNTGDKLEKPLNKINPIGELVGWDPHTRQAVKILRKCYTVQSRNTWDYQVTCDLEKGHFNVNIRLYGAD